jgi:hypothetical protein
MGLLTEPKTEASGGQSNYEEKRQQVARILASPSFRNAPLLQKFLDFITAKSTDGHVEDLGEYTIATQVFGRPQDFDPASDTIVRTQAYRLRTKLKEYYETEGKADSLIIEIPKGHYVPSFSLRHETVPASETAESSESNEIPALGGLSTDRAHEQRSRLIFVIAGVLLLAIAVFLLGTFFGSRWNSAQTAAAAKAKVPYPLDQFWGRFITGNDIIIAYTNSVFLETETGDLLRFRGGAVADRGALAGKEAARDTALNLPLVERAGPLYYEDGYTGTGEVLAVHRLTSILGSLGANVVVKRSRLVTADDFRNHDVIFLGSPFENQVLGDMHFPQRFGFESPKEPPYLWRGRIVDSKPTTADKRFYQVERDPDGQVIRADYALFYVVPGLASNRRIVVLAGLTTSGTQGAAEFATSPEGLEQILEQVGTLSGGHKTIPPYFESLLRVEATKGLDAMKVQCIATSKVQE